MRTIASNVPAPGGIDPRAPRFNQALLGVTLVASFFLEESLPWAKWAVPAWAVLLGLGSVLGPRWSLFGRLWTGAVRPLLRIPPPAKLKDPAPPRFAQTLGFLFLIGATLGLVAFPAGSAAYLIVGWGLALIVAALALLAAVSDICVGCEIYTLGKKLLAGRRERAG